jgi:hypothetical protein
MVHIPVLPSLPPPQPREVVLVVAQEEPQAPARPRRAPHHKTPSVKTAPTADIAAAADKPSQTQASAGTPSDTSPIGQLTSGGDATNIQQRRDIEQLINDTENGLNNIRRTLSNNEQETSTQIRSFLVKAKQALADNDLDGAHTLATKAKVLLDELTKK